MLIMNASAPLVAKKNDQNIVISFSLFYFTLHPFSDFEYDINFDVGGIEPGNDRRYLFFVKCVCVTCFLSFFLKEIFKMFSCFK